MNIQHKRNFNSEGTVLMATLLLCVVLGILMDSYLTMVQSQHQSVARAQAWNSSLAVAEAGVEEAMAELNFTNFTKLHFQGNGWSGVDGDEYEGQGSSTYGKINTLGSGSYDVTVIFTNPYNPLIISKGTVPGPLSGMVTRTVQCRAAPNSNHIASGAMVVSTYVNFNGNNVSTDSFNSTNALYSTNGRYDPAKREDHGDVTTTSTQSNSLMNIGNANIMGTLHAAPGDRMNVGSSGSVGDMAWVSAGTSGIESNHAQYDANQVFPDASLPDTGNYPWLTASPGTYNIQLDDGTTGTFRYLLNNNSGSQPFWRLANLDGSIYVKGAVSLDVTTTANVNGLIYISTNKTTRGVPTSLTMYVEAPSFSVSGNGVVNSSGLARNFQYIGLPSNTSLTVGGNGAFIGQIYAPEADMKLNGGGSSSTNDFTGCSVTRSATMNGHFNFHYDEASSITLHLLGYFVASWDEL